MAKPTFPCHVPGCKGELQRGSHPGGGEKAWCRACERRVVQLAAAQAQPPVAATELTDAQLLKLASSRLVTLHDGARAVKRGTALVRHAVRSGQIPHVSLGRTQLLARESLQAWSAAWKKRPLVLPATKQIIAALPRKGAEAITTAEWAKRAKRPVSAINVWQRHHAKDARLRRGATLNARGSAELRFWWSEEAPRA